MAGEWIYENGAKTGKRMQINMGAKNICAVLPDADREDSVNALVSAAFGSSGQRCMALTTVILIGETQTWIPEIVEKAKKLKLNAGHEPDCDIAPLCYPSVFYYKKSYKKLLKIILLFKRKKYYY